MNDGFDPRLLPGVFRASPRPKHILAVPWFDSRVIPKLPSNKIIANKIMAIKEFLPISGPLAIDMMLAPLVWSGSAKQNQICMSYDRCNECLGRRFWKMLGYFQR